MSLLTRLPLAVALLLALALPMGAGAATTITRDLSTATAVELPAPNTSTNAVPERACANPDGSFSVIALLDRTEVPAHLPNAGEHTVPALAVIGADGLPRAVPGGGFWKMLRAPADFDYVSSFDFSPPGGLVATFEGSTRRTRGKTAIARFRADGSRDRSFGRDGVVRPRMISDSLLDNHEVFAAADGGALLYQSSGLTSSITRFGPRGKLDRGFGSHGTARFRDFDIADVDDGGARMLVSGWRFHSDGEATGAAVVGLSRHGRRIAAFGAGGVMKLANPGKGLVRNPIGVVGSASGDFTVYSSWPTSRSDEPTNAFGLQSFSAGTPPAPLSTPVELYLEPPAGDDYDPDVYQQRAFATAAGTFATYLSAYYPGNPADAFTAFALLDTQTNERSVTELTAPADTVVETIAPKVDGQRVLALTSSKSGKRRGNIRAYLLPAR